MNAEEWEKIRARLIPDGECLIWPGATTGDEDVPYAVGKIKGKGTVLLHREVFGFFHPGELPIGRKEVVEHTCNRSLCLKSDHLSRATQRENLLHSPTTLNSINAAKTHCPQNHAYDEQNTYIAPSGQRVCRKCKAAHARRYRRRGQ